GDRPHVIRRGGGAPRRRGPGARSAAPPGPPPPRTVANRRSLKLLDPVNTLVDSVNLKSRTLPWQRHPPTISLIASARSAASIGSTHAASACWRMAFWEAPTRLRRP